MNNSKPWLKINSVYDIRKNESIYNAEKDIIACLVLQDCNMGGNYYRYYVWTEGEERPYFFVNKIWVFHRPIWTYINGDIALDDDLDRWTCFDKFNNQFIKIFEKKYNF